VSKITQFVRENHPAFRTEPKNPNVMITVEVVASTCFVSVVVNFPRFRNFKMTSFGEKGEEKLAKRMKVASSDLIKPE
jgi:hypothetical protein